jgi:hypothetical protein
LPGCRTTILAINRHFVAGETLHYSSIGNSKPRKEIAMFGLVGFVLMVVMTFMYFNELGWKILAGAWLIILLLPLLLLVGVSGWIVALVQAVVVGGVYVKARSE